MTDHSETHLPLLVAGHWAFEAAEPGDAECPPVQASVSVEIERLWADGLDDHGQVVHIDLLPCLPIEVRRWLARQLAREVEAAAREAGESRRAVEVDAA